MTAVGNRLRGFFVVYQCKDGSDGEVCVKKVRTTVERLVIFMIHSNDDVPYHEREIRRPALGRTDS